MFLFYQFLAERIGEKEYSTAFVKIALKVSALSAQTQIRYNLLILTPVTDPMLHTDGHRS